MFLIKYIGVFVLAIVIALLLLGLIIKVSAFFIFSHDECYEEQHAAGNAKHCKCAGKSLPVCTECPYFTYAIDLSSENRDRIEREIEKILKEG